MGHRFAEAGALLAMGDVDGLAGLLADDPSLATATESNGHPTLLQLVACEAVRIPHAVAATRLLVDAGAATVEPLIAAAGCGSQQVLEQLLDSGADIDGGQDWSPLDEALYWDQIDIAELLIARGARVRALSTAAGLGDPGRLDAFFVDGHLGTSAGPIGSPFPDTVPDALRDDPAAIIDHAFVAAVNSGQLPTAAALLEAGAHVNVRPPGFHWHGTALHAAVWRGSEDLVRWLLDAGADPSIRDGMVDSDAVGWATHHGHDHLLPLLTAVEGRDQLETD